MDISKISGFPLELTGTGELLFPADIKIEETRARSLDELTQVYLDRKACQGSAAAYWMYNGVALSADAPLLDVLPVRYELTLFPDICIGPERVKTHGHIHAIEPDSGLDYPEICEVLVGTAHFLFQDLDLSGPSASTAFVVEVQAGQKLLIPPGFQHLTINPGPGQLLFSDVVARGCSGVYQHLRAAGGAAYCEVVEEGRSRFIPNPRYTSTPALRRAVPCAFPGLDLITGQPLYTSFRETRGALWPFLWQPARFKEAFGDWQSVFQFEG